MEPNQPNPPNHSDVALMARTEAQQALAKDLITVPRYALAPHSPMNRHLLQDYWRIIKRRKLLILLVILGCTTLGTLFSYRYKSLYQAQAILEVGKDNPTIIKTGDTVIQAADYDVRTALQVIQSDPLIEEVIYSLRLNNNPNFTDLSQTRSIGDTFKAVFGGAPKPTSDAKILEDIFLAPPKEKNTPNKRLSGEAQLALDKQIQFVKDNMSVTRTRESRLVNIQVTHTDPVLATAIANGLAKNFRDSNFEDKTNKFTHTSEWLTRTMQEMKAKVEQAERELADYTKANNIFSIEGKETLTTDKLTKLHKEVTEAEIKRNIQQSLYQEVVQGRIEQLPEAFSDPKLVELKKKYGELETENAQLGVKLGTRNPKVQETRQQMTVLEKQIKDNTAALAEKLKSEYERAEKNEASLKASLTRAKGEAVQENQAAIRYNVLKQNKDTATALYNEFLQKSTQAQVQLYEQYNNVRVIEPAKVPLNPTSPRHLQNILLCLFLSAIGALALAFLVDSLDNTIKDSHDISQAVHLPTLAMIPKLITKGNPVLSRKPIAELPMGLEATLITPSQVQPTSLLKLDPQQMFDTISGPTAVEAYSNLRTSILLSTAGGPPKKILITSGLAGEGKSTTVINTAFSLSKLGRSIVVLDADMRRPTIHKAMGVENRLGLSNYLSGEVPLDRVVKETDMPNLYVIPSGTIPPNASELVSSEKMHHLLQQLSRIYDHILIDSPPLVSVTDALIMSTMADGVILVVSSGKCTRDVLRYSTQQLAKVHAKVLGTVLNNFDFKQGEYGYYDYRYYSQFEDGSSFGKASK
ncbi:MAG: polysaccharide biosynthesis tyrosine autokinase [Acidobacteria bacterium]|nr:polysaccharide biosynthesis tyrosine autokinase [Acidobacteriota bacterium]